MNRVLVSSFALILWAVLATDAAHAGQRAAKFTPADGSFTLHYLVHIPDGTKKGAKLPVILFLHGAGERGPADGSNLKIVKVHGPPMLAEKDKKLPYVVISPQCHTGKWWDAKQVKALLDDCLKRYPCDPDRVYLTGLSMGGFGTWATASAYPDAFAAAAPICGGGDPKTVCKMKDLPTWCFHGDKDRAVPLKRSQVMVDALKACDGDIKFTVYKGVGHNSWTQTYNNPALYKWFLSHKRRK